MSDLIERLEAARGADRELDCLIAIAVDARPKVYRREDNQPLIFDQHARVVRVGKNGPAFDPHYYTGSIDAALTLYGKHPRGLHLYQSSNPDMGGKDWCVSHSGSRSAARSWPLAICLDAVRTLRARASQGERT